MAKVGGLQVDLDLLTARFEQGMRRADSHFRRLDANTRRSAVAMQRLNRQFSTVGRTLAGVLGGATASVIFKRSVEMADGIAKVADKLGIGVESLQEWTFAAEQSGLKSEQFQTALQRLGRRVAEAANGTGEARTALERLGISARDSAGNIKTIEDVLPEIATQMGKVGSQQERLAIAMRLFDTEGVAMVNLLRHGAQGMADLRQQAREMGLVISEDVARKAEDTNDQLNIMSRVIKAQVATAMVALGPIIVRVGQAFADAAPKVARFFRTLLDGPSDLDATNAAIQSVERSYAQLEAKLQRIEDIRAGRTKPTGSELVGDLLGNYDPAKVRERMDALKSQYIDLLKLQRQFVVEAQKRAESGTTQDGADWGAWAEMLGPLGQPGSAAKADKAAKEFERLQQRIGAALQATELPLETYRRKVAEVEQWHKKGLVTMEQAQRLLSSYGDEFVQASAKMDRGLEKQKDQWADIKQAVEGFGRSFADTMIQSEGRFRGFANSVVQQLGRIAIARLTDPLFASFGDWIGKTLSSAFPGRAAGGPVTAGQPYVIGERGPELFVPGRSGTVVPNDQLGGGGSVSVAPVYNIDARGASPGTAAALQQVMDRTTERTVALMRDMKRRGRLPEFA